MLELVVLAEEEVEVGLPCVVRRVGLVELDGDAGVDVKIANGGGVGLGTGERIEVAGVGDAMELRRHGEGVGGSGASGGAAW